MAARRRALHRAAGPGRGRRVRRQLQIRTQDNLAWLLRHRPMQPVSVLFTARGAGAALPHWPRPPMYAGQLGPAPGQCRCPAPSTGSAPRAAPGHAGGGLSGMGLDQQIPSSG